MTETILGLENLSVGYGRPTGGRGGHGPQRIGTHARDGDRPPVVAGIDAGLARGSFTCLIGENGSGKSTLLRTVAGMQPPLAGTVRVDGRDVSRLPAEERSKMIAVVLTDSVDAGYLTVRDLVSLGRYPYVGWNARLSADDEASVGHALDALGLAGLAGHRFDRLSDGERQKALIARALAQDTPLMLLDEPTAFLDAPRKIEIAAILRRIARTEGRAILMSSHDLALAFDFPDRLWAIADGRLYAGTPEDLVLSGRIAAAYRSSRVPFNPRTGDFSFPAPEGRPIILSARGAAHRWTVHALERAGFRAVLDGDQAGTGPIPVIAVRTENGASVWELAIGEERIRCTSVEALLAALTDRIG